MGCRKKFIKGCGMKKTKQGIAIVLIAVLLFGFFPTNITASEPYFGLVETFHEQHSQVIAGGGRTARTFGRIPGDVNGDGVVNAADLSFVLSNIGRPVTDANRAADINGDGVINAADLSIVLSNFGRVAEETEGMGEIYYEYRSDVTVISDPPTYTVDEVEDIFTVRVTGTHGQISGLSVGELFVLEPTPENPEGLAGRVTEIRTVGGETIITASMPESLDEIFYDFEFSGEFCLLTDSDNFIIMELDEMFYWEYGGYDFGPFDFNLIEPFGYEEYMPFGQYGEHGIVPFAGFRPVVTKTSRYVDVRFANIAWNGINLNGNLRWYMPSVTANITRHHADLYLSTRAVFNLEADARLLVDRILPLFTIKVIPVKGVSIEIPVGIRVTASGNFELVLRCSFEMGFGIIDGNAGAWANFDFYFNLSAEVQATMSLNIQLRARLLRVHIYGINGDFGKGLRTNNEIVARCPGTGLDSCLVVESFHVRRINSITNWGLLRNISLLRFSVDLARNMDRTLWFLHGATWHRDRCPHGGPTDVPRLNLIYLETDIFSTARTSMRRHPLDGDFTMGGLVYSSGISNSSHSDGTATFNITGQGFTRLSGVYGRIVGNDIGRLVITAGDGSFIAGFTLAPGILTMPINVAIPPGVSVIVIRLQNGSNSRFGFGNAYFVVDNTPPPVPSGNVYLESGIFSESRLGIRRLPLDGSFRMQGVDYFKGIATSGNTSTATFNIAGRGFTRLSGVFGRVSGNHVGRLLITADGVFLAGYTLELGVLPIRIDVAIPPGVSIIVIRFLDHSLGFGNAYFVVDDTPPPIPSGHVYLESGILSAPGGNINRFPLNGSFRMSGVDYFRGISNAGTADGIATFNIAGQGFTRLSGVFGRISGNARGELVITGDGNELGRIALEPGVLTIPVNVVIPPGVSQVVIRLQNATTDRLGFGNAFFAR